MLAEIESLEDIVDAARQVLELTQALPPHVRPWLRGVEAEAERIKYDIDRINRRAAAGYLSWIDRGIREAEEAQGAT
jgi:hypothetical protein